MKIMIAGSRKNTDSAQVERAMQLLEKRGVIATQINHGGAKGTDRHASDYARKHRLKELEIKPDYKNNYGRTAPLIRNTELVEKSEIVIAIYAAGEWRKGGTWDAASKALAAGKATLEMSGTRTEWTAAQLTLW